MRHDLAALLADPAGVDTVPAEQVPALLAHVAAEQARLAALQGALAARLAMAGNATPKPDDNGPGRADAEWLTAREVAVWLGYSERTIRRYMHDGTWRKSEHWFRQKGLRPLFRRGALEAWLQTQAEPAPAVGLAYGPDIPRGRRRRLPFLRNKGTREHRGAATGAEADRAAGRVPGANAADGVAGGE